MRLNEGPCQNCEMRCVGCHGQEPDGTWRCAKWGEFQEKNQRDWAAIQGSIDYKVVKYIAVRRWKSKKFNSKRR